MSNINRQVPLQLKKGMRYSAAVAAAIAVGFAADTMKEQIRAARCAVDDAAAELISKINLAIGADSLDTQAEYFHTLIHRAATFSFADPNAEGGAPKQFTVPADTALYVANDMPYLPSEQRVDVSAYVQQDGIKPLADKLIECGAALDDLEEELSKKQDHLYMELQNFSSLSAILKRYPDAIYFVPKDMVEPAQCESLDALLKSA